MSSTLLVEIGCEELPYRACESIVRQLEGGAEAPGLVQTLLAVERLLPDGEPEIRALVSPRRIAVLVAGVPGARPPRCRSSAAPRPPSPSTRRAS